MKKIILTEADKNKIISEKEKAILESFAKTFNKIKRIDENEITGQMDEGVKNWVVGGILALSSIAGFNKLSDDAKRDESARIQYVNTLSSVVDNLDSAKTIDLAKQYDLTDFGTGSNSAGYIETETSYRDDNGEMVYTNPNVESVKDNIKQEIKNHPENFQISADRTKIIFVK